MDHVGKSFEPERVYEIFTEITKLKHCSKKPGEGCDEKRPVGEDPLREYVIEVVNTYNSECEETGCETKKIEIVHYDKKADDPGERVIVLRRKGSAGKQDKPIVTRQAHMDMVCNPECMEFPIELNHYEEERPDGKKVNMLKGGENNGKNGTTLGDDDGIGVAAALAIITDPDPVGSFGPIECLFTVQEETDMGGARGFDISLIGGSNYINLDSEVANVITYGSAGCTDAEFRLRPASEDVPDGWVSVRVALEGLTGGHSGVNINEGKDNAIRVLAETIGRTKRVSSAEFRIVKFMGGFFHNAIPGKASVVVALPSSQSESFKEKCGLILEAFKALYQDSDPGFKYDISDVNDTPGKMMSAKSSNDLIDMLLAIPNGPLKMLADPDTVVETSSNLAVVSADDSYAPYVAGKARSGYGGYVLQVRHEHHGKSMGLHDSGQSRSLTSIFSRRFG